LFFARSAKKLDSLDFSLPCRAANDFTVSHETNSLPGNKIYVAPLQKFSLKKKVFLLKIKIFVSKIGKFDRIKNQKTIHLLYEFKSSITAAFWIKHFLSSCSPINKFVHYVTVENDLEKAEKLSLIFGLNLQQLLEACGDLMISKGSFHSGIILYKQAKVHLLKRVLKLAISADCRTLLKFVHLCLSASRVDMSMATKIHIGNLAVMAYTELILRHGGHARMSNTKDFM
jgi:hypothetical protein